MGLSPAICCLETFVHASSYPNLPLTITRFILPDDEALYLKPSPSKLPTSWAAIPPGRASMAYGTQWLQQNKYLGLIVPRSEEHTSELQSLMRISYAVFCLKKKNKKHNNTYIRDIYI